MRIRTRARMEVEVEENEEEEEQEEEQEEQEEQKEQEEQQMPEPEQEQQPEPFMSTCRRTDKCRMAVCAGGHAFRRRRRVLAQLGGIARPPELKASTPAHAKHLGWYLEFESRVTHSDSLMRLHRPHLLRLALRLLLPLLLQLILAGHLLRYLAFESRVATQDAGGPGDTAAPWWEDSYFEGATPAPTARRPSLSILAPSFARPSPPQPPPAPSALAEPPGCTLAADEPPPPPPPPPPQGTGRAGRTLAWPIPRPSFPTRGLGARRRRVSSPNPPPRGVDVRACARAAQELERVRHIRRRRALRQLQRQRGGGHRRAGQQQRSGPGERRRAGRGLAVRGWALRLSITS